jgi:DNA-binding transcriptional regulator GbsR (MarR family)
MADASAGIREAEMLASDAIGDVIEHWGFRRALGRVWTLLYLAGEPLSAADIGERLQMSAGAVSMALTELQRWGVAQRTWRPGERKEFYSAETDFWKMISKVLAERERFLAQSVKERLDRAVSLLSGVATSTAARERRDRAKRLLSFASVAQAVLDTFILSRRVDFSEFGNLLDVVQAVRGRGSKG